MCTELCCWPRNLTNLWIVYVVNLLREIFAECLCILVVVRFVAHRRVATKVFATFSLFHFGIFLCARRAAVDFDPRFRVSKKPKRLQVFKQAGGAASVVNETERNSQRIADIFCFHRSREQNKQCVTRRWRLASRAGEQQERSLTFFNINTWLVYPTRMFVYSMNVFGVAWLCVPSFFILWYLRIFVPVYNSLVSFIYRFSVSFVFVLLLCLCVHFICDFSRNSVFMSEYLLKK